MITKILPENTTEWIEVDPVESHIFKDKRIILHPIIVDNTEICIGYSRHTDTFYISKLADQRASPTRNEGEER